MRHFPMSNILQVSHLESNMNKLNFIFIIFFSLFTSCGRQNFGFTELKINLPVIDKNSTGNSFYWIHLYNPDTSFYFSEKIEIGSNRFEIQVPNSSRYLLYGYKVTTYSRVTSGSTVNNNSLMTEKAFFTPLDLNIGGVRIVDINFKNEVLGDSRFFCNEYIVENSNSPPSPFKRPKELIFRPCGTSSTLSTSDCGIDSAQNPGAIQSLRMEFFKFNGGEKFSDAYKIWDSGCKSKNTNFEFIPTNIFIPVTKNANLPMHFRVKFFLDSNCQISHGGGTSETGLPQNKTDIILTNLDLVTNTDQTTPFTVLIFQNGRLGIGEQCYSDINCYSNLYCDLEQFPSRCEQSSEGDTL